VEIFPPREESGKTRDEIGSLAGVSGKTVDKVEYIKEHAPEAAKEQLRTGDHSAAIIMQHYPSHCESNTFQYFFLTIDVSGGISHG